MRSSGGGVIRWEVSTTGRRRPNYLFVKTAASSGFRWASRPAIPSRRSPRVILPPLCKPGLPCSIQQAIERTEDAQHREIALDCYSAQFREPEVVDYPLAKLLLLIRADPI